MPLHLLKVQSEKKREEKREEKEKEEEKKVFQIFGNLLIKEN